MLRLLVADDNPITLDFLAAALRQLGWQAVAVADGAAAVTHAARERFDVLLIDARMPILDGPAALASIRSGHGKSSHSPALATTASSERDTHEVLLAAGFDAVLSKPISIAGLASALHAYDRNERDDPGVLFDDVRAHAVVGGDNNVVKALRGLLLAELERLPGELTLMSRQLDANRQLDERLHRIAASAGFCGAVALEQAVGTLQMAQQRQAGGWPEQEVARFTTTCQQLSQQLRAILGNHDNPLVPGA